MIFGRTNAATLLLKSALLALACLFQTAPLRANEALECRKGYLSDFCAGTMLVAVGQANNAGETELASNLTKLWQEFSTAYKSTIVFDEDTKKFILKNAIDGYSLKTVGGCIGKDKEGAESLINAAFQFCEKR